MSQKSSATSVAPAFVLGVCLAVGIILAGYFIAGAVMESRKGDRVVTVAGSAEKEITANRAVWTLPFEVQATDLPSLGEALLSANAKLGVFLLEQGFAEADFLVLAPEVHRLTPPTPGPSIWSGRGALRLTTSAPEKMPATLAATSTLVEQGIALRPSVNEPVYIFEYPEETISALFREANQEAQRSAQRFGDQTGQAVGAMRRAEQMPLEILPAPTGNPGHQLLRATTTADFLLR